jgi:ATP-dependent Clp protease ATP-binding subunit ClpA
MFERFTEKARRTVFFARYEANQLGSQEITSEHLLLGLLRDDKAVLRQLLLKIDYETVRNDVVARVQPGDLKLPLNVDLPLAEDAKLVLKFAMEEADRLNMRHIGTEHLLLGMLYDAEFPSAKVLARLGADFESLRAKAAEMRERFAVYEKVPNYSRAPLPRPNTVEIHGKKVSVDAIQMTALFLKQHPFYWERKLWQARDGLRKERQALLI